LLLSLQPISGGLYNEDDFVIMTTTEKEKYKCLLPSLTAKDQVSGVNGLWSRNRTGQVRFTRQGVRKGF